jgi:hypothetical protein
MTPDDFVKSVNEMIPSEEDLLTAKIDEDIFNVYINRSFIKNKSDFKDTDTIEDVITYFLSKYDFKFIDIGYNISFRSKPETLNGYTNFGSLEAEYIVRDNKNGIIYIIDYYISDGMTYFDRTYLCADNFERFLEALIPHIGLFWQDILGKQVSQRERAEVSITCAKIASDNYLNAVEFYKTLNGSE